MSESVYYTDLLPHEFRARLAGCPVGYLPLGTLEWHGEHCALGADAHIAAGLFALAAQRLGGIVFPPLFLGPDRAQAGPNDSLLIGMDYAETTTPPRQLDGSCYWVPEGVFLLVCENIIYLPFAHPRERRYTILRTHVFGLVLAFPPRGAPWISNWGSDLSVLVRSMTHTVTYDQLRVRIFDTIEQLAASAADDLALILCQALAEQGSAALVLATGNSQLAFYQRLQARGDIAWQRVTIFHMDEYLGLPEQHPASFRRVLHEQLVDLIRPGVF